MDATANRQMGTTTKLAKLLYKLCIWSLAITGVLKISTTTNMTQSKRLNLTQQSDIIMMTIFTNSTGTYEKIVNDVALRLPGIPITYWYKNIKQPPQKSKNCAKFPAIFDLQFNNIYWQTLQTSNGSFQLFGAYYDNRMTSILKPASVRILAMIDRIDPKVSTYCQLWYDNQKQPAIIKAHEYKYIWVRQWGNYKQGIYQPYLITCRLPNNTAPAAVSLVEHECDTASNSLSVINNRPSGPQQKKAFAVCVKGLDFLYDNMSVRLIEWIELLHILGADMIHFYELQVHPNISKVLQYYVEQGKVQVTPLTLPGGQPNAPGLQHLYLNQKTINKRQNELIPYNDCLYKNLYLFDYIALLDIDEVIMPKGNISDWHVLMSKIVRPASLKTRPSGYHSYHFRNIYFLDDQQSAHGWYQDIPKYLHMLQHVHRAQNYSKPSDYVKSFHDTSRVLTLHNHFPRACLSGSCKSFSVSINHAQMQHYRADCVKELANKCAEYRSNSIEDTTIWKYKQSLIGRTTKTLQQLGYLEKITAK